MRKVSLVPCLLIFYTSNRQAVFFMPKKTYINDYKCIKIK